MTSTELRNWRESHRLPGSPAHLTREELAALLEVSARTLEGQEQKRVMKVHPYTTRALRDLVSRGEVVALES